MSSPHSSAASSSAPDSSSSAAAAASLYATLTSSSSGSGRAYPALVALVEQSARLSERKCFERVQFWQSRGMKIPSWLAPFYIQREDELLKEQRARRDPSLRRPAQRGDLPAKHPRVCTRLNTMRRLLEDGQKGHGDIPCVNVCICVLCRSTAHGCMQKDSTGAFLCPTRVALEKDILNLISTGCVNLSWSVENPGALGTDASTIAGGGGDPRKTEAFEAIDAVVSWKRAQNFGPSDAEYAIKPLPRVAPPPTVNVSARFARPNDESSYSPGYENRNNFNHFSSPNASASFAKVVAADPTAARENALRAAQLAFPLHPAEPAAPIVAAATAPAPMFYESPVDQAAARENALRAANAAFPLASPPIASAPIAFPQQALPLHMFPHAPLAPLRSPASVFAPLPQSSLQFPRHSLPLASAQQQQPPVFTAHVIPQHHPQPQQQYASADLEGEPGGLFDDLLSSPGAPSAASVQVAQAQLPVQAPTSVFASVSPSSAASSARSSPSIPSPSPVTVVAPPPPAPAAQQQTVRVRLFLPGVDLSSAGVSVCADSFAELREEAGLPVDSEMQFSLDAPPEDGSQQVQRLLTEFELWTLAKHTRVYGVELPVVPCQVPWILQKQIAPHAELSDTCGLCKRLLSHQSHH